MEGSLRALRLIWIDVLEICFVSIYGKNKLRSLLQPGATLTVTLNLQYVPRNMHTVFALLCFVVVIHWLIFPYPSGLLHWHCGYLTIAPVPAKQPWWMWINTSYEFIMNDCITTTKQSTAKPCAYFLGYTVVPTRSCFGEKNVWNLPLLCADSGCHDVANYIWYRCLSKVEYIYIT